MQSRISGKIIVNLIGFVAVIVAAVIGLSFYLSSSTIHELLTENPDACVNSAILQDDEFARAHMTRVTARMEVLKYNDDRVMRTALGARPRTRYVFQPGDKVAYWRQDKKGENARWRGLACVLGEMKGKVRRRAAICPFPALMLMLMLC